LIFFEANSDNPMGYAQSLFEICPDGKSSGGTSALLEGVCGMPIQLHAFRRAAAPPLNFHGFWIPLYFEAFQTLCETGFFV
jgi:hypothetical protein